VSIFPNGAPKIHHHPELRKLDKAGRIEAEPVNDDQGRKLHDRLRLKVA